MAGPPPPPLPPRPTGYIWHPPVGTTWNYVLSDPVRLDHTIEQFDVWIIDLFDTPVSTINELHRRGRKVIAYFSAGTYEDWRPDAHLFPREALGRPLSGGWEGERWIETNSAPIRANIMIPRLELAASKGFDGVDPDNIDGWDNRNGLGLTPEGAVSYVSWLAREAHRRGLACGLKNGATIVPRLVEVVQYAVVEQALQYGEARSYVPIIEAGKPVFHVEYPKGDDPDSKKQNDGKDVRGAKRDKCFAGRELGFSTIIKNVKLDQWVQTS
ncbi:hypothetical protein M406DRAFT_41945 [Cryphonectria parasitica EP155]|uniref:alpha-galactosidase n=1 Tax=Cryphonectria parasitica (strain ATCC 38755 / EP155) TaxID=660469 RepID=A0A9P4Y170_CRYP1|nr:uncharacterized protein M406DRAFT_41945 [Cryphonectria parasitica EP155]KAF3764265.1 hypothetical protein M406DRAFT_41945 [Cryphonectria parasitica EP155]